MTDYSIVAQTMSIIHHFVKPYISMTAVPSSFCALCYCCYCCIRSTPTSFPDRPANVYFCSPNHRQQDYVYRLTIFMISR